MNRFVLYSFAALVVISVQICYAARLGGSIEDETRSGRAVTEPAWVTELLGPTLTPPVTTKRPTLPNRIQVVIQMVAETIRQFPDRIGDIFGGVRQAATQIIIRRPSITARPQARPSRITDAPTNKPPTNSSIYKNDIL